MKKFIIIFVIIFSFISCSSVKLKISNDAVKTRLSNKIDAERNFKNLIKLTTKLENFYIRDNKLFILINIKSNKYLDADVLIQSALRYENGKIYTKDVKIEFIKGLGNQILSQEILDYIINLLLINKEIFDVRSKNISPNVIKNVYVGKNNIIIEM